MARCSGNVTDETGAALPGATVTITQRETNLTRDVVTDASGGYNVPNLLPGTYQVDVKLAGFSTFTTRDIAVRQGLDVRVDAKLKLGTLEESIIVSGEAAVLQTESAAVQSLTTSRELETIPTSGRAWQTTIALMPGVAQPDYSQSEAATTRPGRWRSASTASRRTTRSSGSMASRRSTSSSSRFRRTVPAWKRSKPSASSPTASTPIRGWPAARR
jgi:hypothetical protein